MMGKLNSKGKEHWVNPDLAWRQADEAREQKPIPIRKPRPVPPTPPPTQPVPAKRPAARAKSRAVSPLEVLRFKQMELARQSIYDTGVEMRATTDKIWDAKARGESAVALELEKHWHGLFEQLNELKKGLAELERNEQK